MDFTKVRLVGLSTVDLPIVGALPSDPYILKNADGLGPPESDVFIANTLYLGGVYQGRRPQGREIVLTVGLSPNYTSGQTVQSLRTALYGLLTPGTVEDSIPVQIMNGSTIVAVTDGYVKNIVPVYFTKDPEVQITITCAQSYLQAPAVVNVATASLSKTAPSIVNAGTAPTGFHMEVTFTAAKSVLTIGTDATFLKQMRFDYSFLSGDTLVFDTRPGLRSVQLIRNGVTSNIISALNSASTWLLLHGGVNTFSVITNTFNWGPVFYTPQYWGV